MDPITLSLILGGTGLAKSFLVDKPKEDRQRQEASATQRYSPWTGLKANDIQEADPFGSALQGAATGASMGQNMQAAKGNAALTDAQTKFYNSQTPQPSTDMMSMEAPADDFGSMSYDDYRKKNPAMGAKKYSAFGG